MGQFPRYVLQEDFIIKKLVTFHYNELNKDYLYPGERHDFWEFLYLDKGEITITTDRNTFDLRQGDLVFYSPNEFHSLKANNKVASNILIVSFECGGSAMTFFEGKFFRLDDEERGHLANILREGLHAFDPPVDKPGGDLMRRNPPPFGSEQMIKINLEALLIRLVRRAHGMEQEIRLSLAAKEHHERELSARIIHYLRENLAANLTIDQIGRYFGIARTPLTTVFKKETGLSIMDYYHTLKIEQAKSMIREETYNFTAIADLLGFSSIHYFSRYFKKSTDMTPSEYARSLNARHSRQGKRIPLHETGEV
ncbi:AraC family transcriptional regulator [Paenibacillus mendelii]|uniref:Helix-turn-helix domain-containing protein n=1 Tax=Paenibacillus mendelii TaxID=206163 RepID=A0ABV6JPQ0_9BACL|nr:AraC family transcriptional regulator [Paenibacillus mendelii]MCQ6560642.1 AraC family transcriptional regulator [Paenibacillus mendelii]